MSYKYCIVPQCKSTTSSTPNKLFFRVPMDQKTRIKWCSVMKRDRLSSKSTHYCCEDHFDVENDMENYIRYRLMGGQLRLKKGILPHKFDCQRKENTVVERPGYKKRQQIEYFERVLNPEIGHENLFTQEEFVACESIDIDANDTEVLDPIADIDMTTEHPYHKSVAVFSMKSCRVCLDLDTTVTHLGNSEAVQHLQEILKNHGLDELHSEHYICFMCKYLLNKYFSFVKSIIRAQEAFRDIKGLTIKNVKFTTLNRSKLNLNLNLSCHSITNFYCGSNIEDHNDIVNISVKGDDNYENNSFSDNPVVLNPIDISIIDNNSENQETENIYEDSDDNKSVMVFKIEKDETNDKKEEKSFRKKKRKTNVIKPKTKQTDSDEDYNPEYDSASSGSSNEYFNYAGYIARRDFRVFPLECDDCGAVVESKKEHHRHYIIHHQDIEYPYGSKSKFVCQHCGVTRRTITDLKTHEKIHGEKNVECNECGKKFHSYTLMRRHQVFHRKKAFICDYCNKGFHHRADLRLHIRTHTGEKPFKCHLCDARFAHKGNIGIHIRTRHQQVPRNTCNKVNGKRGKWKGRRGEGAKKKTKTNNECAKKKSNKNLKKEKY